MPLCRPRRVVVEERERTLTELTAEPRALTQLKVIFDSADANYDGSVCEAELSYALGSNEKLGALIKQAGLNEQLQVLQQLDTNADGRVTWDEFQSHLKTAAVEEVKVRGDVEAVELPAGEKALKQLRAIFEGADADADGAVSRDELAVALSKDESVQKFFVDAGFRPHSLMEQLDTNGDRRIVFAEFKALSTAAVNEVKDRGSVEVATVLEREPRPQKGFWCH